MVSKWLEDIVGGGPASSQSLNKDERLVHPRPRRWSCAGMEFLDLRSCHNPSTRNTWQVVVTCFLDQDGSKRILPPWLGSKPWRQWKKPRCCLFSQTRKSSSPLLHAQRGDLCFVVTDTRVKEPGVRDWRQCEQWREFPKDSVVCGLNRICTGRTGDVSHIHPQKHSCKRFSGMQLVCASYIPKLKLPCPRASAKSPFLVSSRRKWAPAGERNTKSHSYSCYEMLANITTWCTAFSPSRSKSVCRGLPGRGFCLCLLFCFDCWRHVTNSARSVGFSYCKCFHKRVSLLGTSFCLCLRFCFDCWRQRH